MAQSRRLRTNSVAHRCQRMVIRHKRPKARDFIDRRYRHRSVVEESERAKNRAKSKVRSKVENSIAWHNAPPLAECGMTSRANSVIDCFTSAGADLAPLLAVVHITRCGAGQFDMVDDLLSADRRLRSALRQERQVSTGWWR